MEKETWKFIDGTRNHYEVSNKGRVRKDKKWCTPRENQEHRINILGKHMRGSKNPMYGVSGEKSPVFKGYILQLDHEGNIVGRYAGSGEAAKAVKGTPSNVLRVINKDRTYHGFKWVRE